MSLVATCASPGPCDCGPPEPNLDLVALVLTSGSPDTADLVLFYASPGPSDSVPNLGLHGPSDSVLTQASLGPGYSNPNLGLNLTRDLWSHSGPQAKLVTLNSPLGLTLTW